MRPFQALRMRTPTASASFNPTSLFTGGAQGIIIDPRQSSTLFTDTAGTTQATTTDLIARANDFSGNGNHLTQATSGSRPSLQVDGSGKPYLSFDGTADTLFLNTANLRFTANMTIMAVVYRTASGRFDPIATCETSPASTKVPYEFRIDNTNKLVWVHADNNGFETKSTAALVTSGARHVVSARRITDIDMRIAFKLNATQELSTDTQRTPTSDANSVFHMGGRAAGGIWFQGRIYYLLVINRVLTTDEFSNMETHLATV